MSFREDFKKALALRREATVGKILTGNNTPEEYRGYCGTLRGLDQALDVFEEVWRKKIDDGFTDPDD